MSNIQQLSPYLKTLEIFGLQFFSLSTLDFKLKKLKFVSKYFKIYLLIVICPLLSYVCYSRYTMYQGYEFKSNNALEFVFRVLAMLIMVIRKILSIFEPFWKVKSYQKFFIILNDFCLIFKYEFNLKIDFKNFKKILIFRNIFAVFAALSLVSFDLIVDGDFEDIYYYFTYSLHFIELYAKYLSIYSFCFYVDLISICLKNVLDVIDQLPLYKHNKKILLCKIYQIKRSYIYVIKMTDKVNYFMFFTKNLLELGEIVWILTLLYVAINIYYVLEQITLLIMFGKIFSQLLFLKLKLNIFRRPFSHSVWIFYNLLLDIVLSESG